MKEAREREAQLKQQIREKEAQIVHLQGELQSLVSRELSQRDKLAEAEELTSRIGEQKEDAEAGLQQAERQVQALQNEIQGLRNMLSQQNSGEQKTQDVVDKLRQEI